MAQLGKRKGSYISKRGMTEFKPKKTSLVGKLKMGISRASARVTKVKHAVGRGVSKVITKEEARGIGKGIGNVGKGIGKVAKSKPVKKIGSALQGYAARQQRMWGIK